MRVVRLRAQLEASCARAGVLPLPMRSWAEFGRSVGYPAAVLPAEDGRRRRPPAGPALSS
jgi:hypothetical protein